MKGKGDQEKKKGKGEPSEPEPSEAPRKRGGPREEFDMETWKNGQQTSKKSMKGTETSPNQGSRAFLCVQDLATSLKCFKISLDIAGKFADLWQLFGISLH